MKRILALVLAVVIATALMGCAQQTPATNDSKDAQQATEQSDGQKTGEESTVEKAEKVAIEETDFTKGTHHAEMLIKGYRTPIEIEIYSDSAPKTSAKFCEMVQSKYYNGKPLFWILEGMSVKMGNTEQDNKYLITGEYEESDFNNSNSLKKGVIALSRAEDGQQSDASSFIVFLSDVSYLDGKYAGFGKITSGVELIEHLAELTQAPEEEQRIEIDENGKIVNEDQCPKIRSIAIID